MAKEFVVAIELGSSKITGIAGRKNLDGSISVLAVVKEDSTQCIRKGVIYNIDKTCACLTNIVKRLRTQLRTDITHVYVGVGGQSIRSVKNVIVKELQTEEVVTQQMVDELMDANRTMAYPDQEILYAATQEYKVGTQFQLDPVGIPCSRLEGNILNILWRKAFYKNLNKCFETAGIPIADMLLAPLMLADNVLTEAEKRAGCMLVDLGADTTTVSVYYKNILRHLAVIPLGGNNITKDIAALQMEESNAERLKLEYASAWTENNDIDNGQTIPIDQDRNIEARRFVEIVEARMQEIIENVKFQVPSEYDDKLLGGIIITGGGANMRNIERACRHHTHIEKIRIAKTVTQTVSSNDPDINANNCMMNTILGLLIKGDMNCAGKEINPDGDLFDDGIGNTVAGNSDIHRQPRKIGETGDGIVLTEAEKKKAEEEQQRKEEEERRRREEEEEEERRLQEEEEKKKRENKPINKFFKNIKKFLDQVVSDKVD